MCGKEATMRKNKTKTVLLRIELTIKYHAMPLTKLCESIGE